MFHLVHYTYVDLNNGSRVERLCHEVEALRRLTVPELEIVIANVLEDQLQGEYKDLKIQSVLLVGECDEAAGVVSPVFDEDEEDSPFPDARDVACFLGGLWTGSFLLLLFSRII